MNNTIALLATAGLLAVGGPIHAQAKPAAAAVAKGKVIYQRYCASCHGLEARGDGTLASDLRVTPTDLSTLGAKNAGKFPFDAVARAVDGRNTTRGHGAPDMPVWGEIFPKTAGTESPSTATAVGRLTHYLWSIQH